MEGTREEDKFAFASSAITLINTFTNLNSLPLPEEREQAFKSSSNYKLKSKISFTKPDKTYLPIIVKSGINYNNDFFTLKHDFIKTKEDIVITLDFESIKQTIEKSQYRKFYDSIKNAIKGSESIVVYEKKVSTNKPSSVVTNSNESSEFTKLLSEARSSLDKADYENAKIMAEKSVQINAKSAEAYYILGLANGFLDDYDASDKFLKKAEDLGYQP
ncbi:MAG: hypothetical protein AB8D52_03425 [Gammaproteobacteria bacterium]